MKKIFFVFSIVIFLSRVSSGQANETAILSMKDRAATIDRLLEDKIQNYLPGLMRREGIDMWVVISREYNEDPVIETLLPATWLAARRRTILIMYDRGEETGVEALAVSRYDVGSIFKSAWDKEAQPDQWARVAEIIKERNPGKIAINQSEHFGLADGVVATDLDALKRALDPLRFWDNLPATKYRSTAARLYT